MTPQQAREREIAFQVLSSTEVHTLDALGDTLLPGSAEAGLAHFLDQQLAASFEDQMLMLKYLGVPAPFDGFYQSGLAALNIVAQRTAGAEFADLEANVQKRLVGAIAQEQPDGWEGPPSQFFYFVLRNDAVDVSYGTQAGTESLGIPYMAHILPPGRWGA